MRLTRCAGTWSLATTSRWLGSDLRHVAGLCRACWRESACGRPRRHPDREIFTHLDGQLHPQTEQPSRSSCLGCCSRDRRSAVTVNRAHPSEHECGSRRAPHERRGIRHRRARRSSPKLDRVDARASWRCTSPPAGPSWLIVVRFQQRPCPAPTPGDGAAPLSDRVADGGGSS